MLLPRAAVRSRRSSPTSRQNHAKNCSRNSWMLFLYELAQRVQEMPSSLALRESLWVYPIIETAHVLGLCLFVGTAWLWDLRLLGITLKRVPVSQASAQILPWTAAGFGVMAISGVGLVFSEPLRF